MSAFGVALTWCVIQVTLLSVLVAVGYGLTRRYGSATRVRVVFGGLVIVAGLSTFALSSWPRWLSGPSRVPDPSLQGHAPALATTGLRGVSASSAAAGTGAGGEFPGAAPGGGPTLLETVWQAVIGELTARHDVAWREPRRWPLVVVIAFLAVATIGLLRFTLGLIGVHVYCRESRVLRDGDLLGRVDALAARLGCRTAVTIRESHQLETAATVGWRNPVILLPAHWRTWTARERSAVLAHELAHIRRRDFATQLLAEACLVLHFYHSLLHWLVGRLPSGLKCLLAKHLMIERRHDVHSHCPSTPPHALGRRAPFP